MWPRGALALMALACLAVVGCAGDEASSRQPRPPVVLLIFDEFPTDDLLGPNGEIDAERFPNFAALAQRSTWFRNAVTVYDSTFKAVPSILDGLLPARLTAPDVRSHHYTIYHVFDALGYDVIDVESGTALCPPRVCEGAPTRRPGILARLAGSGRPSRLHAWIGAIRRRARPTLYVQHTLLPHEPWLYLPSGRRSRPPGEDPIEGINKPNGFHDVGLTEHARQRHLLQAGFVDREIGRLLARLRRTRLLDEALLVVVADHGYSFDVGASSRRQVLESNIEEIAPVPLFVKEPGQTDGRVDDAFVRTVDVLPTIADVLDLRLAHRRDGRSAFSQATRARRVVRMQRRDFSRVVSMDGRELLRRRHANRLRWARTYGTGALSSVLYGDPWAAAYRIGPNPELLGQRADSLPVADAQGLGAQLYNAELLRSVDDADETVPTRVTGVIEGGQRGELRELAVAVNGRIEAVGRSFRLRGRRPEFYSLLVPESSLREGANRLELFEVRGGGRRLARLYETPGAE